MSEEANKQEEIKSEETNLDNTVLETKPDAVPETEAGSEVATPGAEEPVQEKPMTVSEKILDLETQLEAAEEQIKTLQDDKTILEADLKKALGPKPTGSNPFRTVFCDGSLLVLAQQIGNAGVVEVVNGVPTFIPGAKLSPMGDGTVVVG